MLASNYCLLTALDCPFYNTVFNANFKLLFFQTSETFLEPKLFASLFQRSRQVSSRGLECKLLGSAGLKALSAHTWGPCIEWDIIYFQDMLIEHFCLSWCQPFVHFSRLLLLPHILSFQIGIFLCPHSKTRRHLQWVNMPHLTVWLYYVHWLVWIAASQLVMGERLLMNCGIDPRWCEV